MLTARGEESERIIGLLGGADDYLPKPFNPLELAARIQAVLKRSRGGEPGATGPGLAPWWWGRCGSTSGAGSSGAEGAAWR